MSLLDTSDKVFWHGYVDFYEPFFAGRDFRNIAEVGLFKGNSIRWLLQRFPQATVCGADILPVQPEWPVDARFRFTQLDQGDVQRVRAFFRQRDFDLIIEDGSHFPHHQVIALVEGMRALRSGGLYVLEDIHTSHPAYGREDGAGRAQVPGNALSVLLAIDHYQRIGQPVDAARAARIAQGSIMRAEDVLELAASIARLALYRRTRLPDYCYRCGSSDYDFSAWRCSCGVEVFGDADSMSFVITRR